jgi:hypothetical protein
VKNIIEIVQKKSALNSSSRISNRNMLAVHAHFRRSWVEENSKKQLPRHSKHKTKY